MLYRCGVVIDIGASEPDPLPAATVGAATVGWKGRQKWNGCAGAGGGGAGCACGVSGARATHWRASMAAILACVSAVGARG
jgi:hypothetical protein